MTIEAITISGGYAGSPASVKVYKRDEKGVKSFILELDEAKEIIRERLEKGHKTTLQPRQQIERIVRA